MLKQAGGTNKVVEGSNVYDWPCFLFANAMTVLTADFKMAFWSARSGLNQTMLLLFSFLYFIQLCDSRKIRYLTREFRIKLHFNACNVTRNSLSGNEFSYNMRCYRLKKLDASRTFNQASYHNSKWYSAGIEHSKKRKE